METLGFEISGKPDSFRVNDGQLHWFRPHRYPMVLLENITECCLPEKRLTGTKQVRHDDPYVRAHFPGDPFMPASFIVECLAQAAGCLMNMLFYHDRGIKLWNITTDELDKLIQPPYNVLAEAKIKQIDLARPGDTLTLNTSVMLQRKDIIAFHADAKIDERCIATGEVILAFPPYTPVAIVLHPEGSEATDGSR